MEEANEKKDAALSNNNSNILGYNVTAIQVGLVVADEFQAHAQQVARMARRLLPDRLQTIVLTPSLDPWPPTVLLIVCCSQPNFPSQRVSEYVKHKPVLVLTDLDLNRFLVDRRAFYQQLEVGGLALFLPRRALYRADDYDPGILIDRNDQIEVNGTILYKPVLERLNDPNSPKVRVYYPRRHGGGCKVLTFLEDDDDNASNDGFSVLDCTAKFESETRHLKKHEGGTWIYEEVADIEEIRTRKRQRKRDVVKSFVKKLSGVDSAEDNIFGDDDQVSFESDLSRLDRKIFVVTTAALPWMTGTAVNPLLRVAYLKRGRPTGFVTLVIPWLERESDRKAVYGDKQQFATPEEQEVFVRDWLRKQANMPEEADPATGLKIL